MNPANGRTWMCVLQMIPTGAGDPLLRRLAAARAPDRRWRSWSSRPLRRAKLGAGPGDRLVARIDRHREGRDEDAVWELTVTGVLARRRPWRRRRPWCPLALLVATEDYRDGVTVPELGWEGAPVPAGPRTFARFRLYATSIYAVAGLAADLTAEGLEVRTQVAEIAAMQALDRNLTRVFWLIALIGTLGFLASLAANLLANVERKRRELWHRAADRLSDPQPGPVPGGPGGAGGHAGGAGGAGGLPAGGHRPERLVRREPASRGVHLPAAADPSADRARRDPARGGGRRRLGRLAGGAHRAGGGSARCLTCRALGWGTARPARLSQMRCVALRLHLDVAARLRRRSAASWVQNVSTLSLSTTHSASAFIVECSAPSK